MLSARLVTVLLCFAAMGASVSTAQVVPRKSADTKYISQSERDEFYAERRAARRKGLPRLIFVPGILGSKIDECRADNSQCTNIWGTVNAIRRNDIDLSIRPDRKYRTDVVERVFFKNIYGDILERIRAKAESLASDSPDDPLVTVFHYDWRYSNGENAEQLKDIVCYIRQHAESSPIIIVAHSMGGLLTKIWAARHAKEQCPGGHLPQVAQILFVATPHLGSPKAIKAVAEGYNINFDELTGLERYLGILERNYVLDAVNSAGISFPSLYELLPIRTSEYCVQLKPILNKVTIPVVGEDDKPLNLFDIDVWRRYDLLRRIGAAPVRRSFYDHDLAPILKQTENLLCEIVDFDPSTVAEISYIFGREKTDRTYGWFHLHSGLSSGSIDGSKPMQGDGTVPVYSAQNFLISSTRQTAEVEADHTRIASSQMLSDRIDEIYDTATRRADIEPALSDTRYASVLVTETAASGNLIPVSLDPNEWTTKDNKLATEINAKALALIGYEPADVARLAFTVRDANKKAHLYAVAASGTNEPAERLKLISDVARASYEGRQFETAIRSSVFVTATAASTLQENDPNAIALIKAAKEVEGWAYLRKGDLTKFNELASAYATEYAVTKDSFKEPISELFDPVMSRAIAQSESVELRNVSPGKRMVTKARRKRH